jgi:hypothetical protein
MTEDLGSLFRKYGSDKDVNGYTPLYHSLFKHLREKPLEILEIGIGTLIPGAPSSMVGYAQPGYKPGGSLRAWRDYFPKATILGCDIQPDTQFTDDRITTMLCDSRREELLWPALGNRRFDIIIDDGSHWDECQRKTLQNLWRYVKPGGFYIIEDVTETSRIPTEFRKQIQDIVAGAPLFFTEKKNICVISKPFY